MTTGLGRVMALQWRTHRGLLLLTPALLAVVVTATAAGIAELYPTAEQRLTYQQTMGSSPAAATFNGRGHDLETLGGIVAYEVGFMGQLALPVIGLLLPIRLTRHLEDTGIMELVTAGRISRATVPLAASVTVTLAWLMFAALTTAGLVTVGLPTAGSIRYSAILTACGMSASAVGLVLAQLASTARTALTSGIALTLATFTMRAVVDGRQLDQVWLSPLGWIAESRPWGEWVWWPLAAFGASALLATTIGVGLALRRDLGSGVLPVKLGRPTASPWLRGPLGLAWRLGRGGILAWGLGAVVWAAAIGAMQQEFVDVMRANPSLAEAFGEQASSLGTIMALLLTNTMASAAGLTVVMRLGQEEESGRYGLLLSATQGRVRWWAAFTGLALVSTLVITLASAAVLGLVQWSVLDQRDAFERALRAGAWNLVPCLALVGIGAVFVGLAPRLRWLAWLPLGWALVVGILGEPLRLPQWAKDLSLLQLIGQVPLEAGDRVATAAIAVTTACALGVAILLHRRRDLLRG
ncbi:ABC transporter permease [Luteococcus sp. OSA5]|uniref:ABC transporter permease n=1 Tax=Luteococcus sp. OSA5 TaxID=3401630 RepID=UPI003B438FEA